MKEIKKKRLKTCIWFSSSSSSLDFQFILKTTANQHHHQKIDRLIALRLLLGNNFMKKLCVKQQQQQPTHTHTHCRISKSIKPIDFSCFWVFDS